MELVKQKFFLYQSLWKDLSEKVDLSLPQNVFMGQILINLILNVNLQLIQMSFFELINSDCSSSLSNFKSYYSQTPLNLLLDNFFIIILLLLNFSLLMMMKCFLFLAFMVKMIFELHSMPILFNLLLNLLVLHDLNLQVLYQ